MRWFFRLLLPRNRKAPKPTASITRQPDLAKPAQTAKWFSANCPSWRKGGAK